MDIQTNTLGMKITTIEEVLGVITKTASAKLVTISKQVNQMLELQTSIDPLSSWTEKEWNWGGRISRIGEELKDLESVYRLQLDLKRLLEKSSPKP